MIPAADELLVTPGAHMRERSRAANRILGLLDDTFLSPVALAYPRRYYIALSLLCDIECPHCPRQYYPRLLDHGFMRAEGLERVYPYLRYAEFVGLFGLGEPFLHPNFFSILRQVKTVGAWAATSTHGMSLTAEVCERIIAEGLDELEVSIDGASPETFDVLRQGAKFETVVDNVRRLQDIKRARGVAKPRVNIPCTISRRNVDEMDAMVRLAADFGADQLIFTDLIVIDPRQAQESVAGTPRFRERLKQALELAASRGLNAVYAPQKPFPWLLDFDGGRESHLGGTDAIHGCRSAWGELNIERQGAVKPCCYLEGPFGNAFDTGLGDLINGPSQLRLRKAMTSGRLWKECRGCGRLLRLGWDHVERKLQEAQAALNAAPDSRPGSENAVFQEAPAQAPPDHVPAARQGALYGASSNSDQWASGGTHRDNGHDTGSSAAPWALYPGERAILADYISRYRALAELRRNDAAPPTHGPDGAASL
ncbi:MAG: hypothetical protein Kow0059_10520 [Candidatus Sumerlaeia bacterium]